MNLHQFLGFLVAPQGSEQQVDTLLSGVNSSALIKVERWPCVTLAGTHNTTDKSIKPPCVREKIIVKSSLRAGVFVDGRNVPIDRAEGAVKAHNPHRL